MEVKRCGGNEKNSVNEDIPKFHWNARGRRVVRNDNSEGSERDPCRCRTT